MKGSDLDRWLLLYRDTRDPEAIGRLFDATAPHLLRVARHLVRDAAEAEDLVQCAFLTLLEHPERYDGVRPAKAWMLGILTKEALAHRRRAARQIDLRELAEARAAGEAASDPGRQAVEDEHAALVRNALSRVPELYRAVLEGHLLRGEQPSALAARFGRPPATVRVHLHRGLEHLRRLLPAGLSAALALHLSEPAGAARGLAAVRAEVVAHAAARAGSTAAGTAAAVAGAGGLVGAIVMTKKIAAVGAAAVLASLLWVLARDREADATAAGTGNALTAVTAEPDGAEPGPEVARGSPEPERAPVETAASPEPSPPGRLVDTLRVITVFDDGTRAPSVGLRIHPLAGSAGAREARTDASGEVALEGLEPGQQYVLYADRGGHTLAQMHQVRVQGDGPLPPELEELLTCVFRLPAGRDVRGRVVDGAGRPVPGAEIWVTTGIERASGTVVATTGADGSFELRQLGAECFLGARAAGHAPSRALHVEHEAERARLRGEQGNAPLTCELELPGPSARVSGTVRDPSGRPVAGARVRAGAQDFHDTLGPGGVEGPPPPVEVRTDATGRFEAAGLAPGRIEIACLAEGFPVAASALDVEPGAGGALDLRLEPPAWVRGRVVPEADTPPVELWVRAIEQRLQSRGARSSFDRGMVVPDGEGRFELGPLGAGPVRLIARAFDGSATASAEIDVRSGGVHGWEVRLERMLSITGRALDERGEPLAGWGVVADPMAPADPPPTAATSGEDGSFELRFPAGGRVRLELHPPQDPESTRWVATAPHAWMEDVGVGARDLRLIARASLRPTAVLRGAIMTTAGGATRAALWVFHPRFDLVAELDLPLGPFEVPDLPEGSLTVRVEAPGHAPLRRRGIEVRHGERVDMGVLALEPAATLVLDILDREAPPRALPHVTLRDAGGDAHHGAFTGTRWTSEGLPAGAYSVLVAAEDRADARLAVALASGETLEREVALVRGGPLGVAFVDAAGAPLGLPIDVVARDGSGRVWLEERVPAPSAGPAVLFLRPPFGPLRIEARASDGRVGLWELDFRGQHPAAQTHRLELK